MSKWKSRNSGTVLRVKCGKRMDYDLFYSVASTTWCTSHRSGNSIRTCPNVTKIYTRLADGIQSSFASSILHLFWLTFRSLRRHFKRFATCVLILNTKWRMVVMLISSTIQWKWVFEEERLILWLRWQEMCSTLVDEDVKRSCVRTPSSRFLFIPILDEIRSGTCNCIERHYTNHWVNISQQNIHFCHLTGLWNLQRPLPSNVKSSRDSMKKYCWSPVVVWELLVLVWCIIICC